MNDLDKVLRMMSVLLIDKKKLIYCILQRNKFEMLHMNCLYH